MSVPAQPAIVGFEELTDGAGLIRVPPPAVEERPQPKRRSGSQKRQRQHVKRCRYGAYIRACTIGGEGPRARRRLSIDREALARAVVEFNRAGSNLNQVARALNEIAAAGRAGEERDRLAELVAELALPIRSLQTQFAVPVAAILAVLGRESGT